MIRSSWALALLVLLLLSGCTPTVTPTVAPAPQPTFQCTPEAGGAAFACDQTAYDGMLAKNALYAAGERLIAAYVAEDAKQKAHAETAQVSDAMKALVTEDYAKTLAVIYASIKADRISLSSPPRVDGLRREVDVQSRGSVAAMSACVDWTVSDAVLNGKVIDKGPRTRVSFYFVGTPTALKVTHAEEDVVTSCAG